MMPKLPRPCYFDDLTMAAERGELSALALAVDGPLDALPEAVRLWRNVLPMTSLILFSPAPYQAAIETIALNDPNIAVHLIEGYDDIVRDSTFATCYVWATCAPYDAYGVLVKESIEAAIGSLISVNKGVFLAHDPTYRVIRWFGGDGVRDRLRMRPYRRRIYRVVCHAVHFAADLMSRFSASPDSWRRI